MSTRPVKGWQLIAGLVAAALAMPTVAAAAEPSFAIELEVGPVWQSGNTVQIPWDPLESTCRHASLSIL